MATTDDLPPGVVFLTITDYGFFPGTVATVNSIFHPSVLAAQDQRRRGRLRRRLGVGVREARRLFSI
jgi:hypothetical protein